ncbi:uncharacterized protein LOC108863311 isoform X2 [Raphanus sativus]|uniref:Uncharacterized protein LOC108863311 isoform X2 n=1 Tax=Raphanus sativus TaxID=3726 RepID=A0A9W3BSI4_RAPSA|nr:uncharacterized protein LOC108863311 isoform X2 [Raphanus sativus]
MESAPTGCFKCGRPGHWSRDCPSSAPVAGGNPAPSSSQTPNNDSQRSFPKSGNSAAAAAGGPVPKATKARVQRPKLTPEMLLSEDGLGYVLRHFPRSFKYRGRGKEVSDLGNLIRMYSEWHSHLLPYYSFDQFVHKVQQVAATKRVKICINELRERVASGVDPNKLYEKQEDNALLSDDQGDVDVDMDQPRSDEENIPPKKRVDADVDADTNADAFQDSMLDEIFDNATDSRPAQKLPSVEKEMDQGNELTEEQRARMEANRLKAMERAQNISEEQRLRMETNRLKALERAKARWRR